MLLTIFGAGASYDSVDLSIVPSLRYSVEVEGRFRPPLANQLFDERHEFVEAMNHYPQMSAIVPRLRRASESHSGQTVEEVLRNIQVEADVFPRRKNHLIALEFYLSEILDVPVSEWLAAAGRATNYVELIDQLGRSHLESRPLFVTFNYDRMLEGALADVLPSDIERLDDYITPDFTLIKPHGSVDWLRPIKLPLTTAARTNLVEAVIYSAAQLRDTGEIMTKKDLETRGVGSWHPASHTA